MKIKKGDEVIVIRGKDKGKQGKIDRVFPKENAVLLPSVNLYKRHMKARTQNQKSDIIALAKPLPVSNVMFVCPRCKKRTRLGYRVENGVKIRICKKCEQQV